MHVTGGQQWVMRASLVTASGPGWVTFAYDQSSPYGMPTKGNHFYLTGKGAVVIRQENGIARQTARFRSGRPAAPTPRIKPLK